MILQILAMATRWIRRVAAPRQHDESVALVAKARANNDNRHLAHGVLRLRQPFRDQTEGIEPAEIVPGDFQGAIGASREINGIPRPSLVKSVGESGDPIANVAPQTVDVNVQLVLTSFAGGVDGERDVVTRQRPAQALKQEASGVPGVGEPVGRVGRDNIRAFNSRDSTRRDQQELRAADKVFENDEAIRLALRHIDQRAGLGIAGGDAKLAAATALWLGWDTVGNYGLTTAVLGGFLSIGLLAARKCPMPEALLRREWIARLYHPQTGIPYGMALATAGLLVYPESLVWLKTVAA